MATSTALYVDEKCTFSIREDNPIPEPTDGEVLIETHFSGVNPADTKHATLLGIYPAVLGYDFCGTVLKTHPNSSFKPGDIIAGYTPTGIGRLLKHGTHQRYLTCPEHLAFTVPDNLPPHHAACLTVVGMTAADALYNAFKFPLPQTVSDDDIPTGGVLIWGASTSVGICAVQFAKASGVYPIFVTASPSRHALLLDLGATHCFDYKSSSVASEIQSALQETSSNLLYGFDTVGSTDGSSATLLAACVSPAALLLCTTIQPDPRFKMPLATADADVTLHPAGLPHPITIPARPADHQRAWNALSWAVRNYGSQFRLPSVDIFEGSAAEALREVKALAELGRGFGKLALRHPLH